MENHGQMHDEIVNELTADKQTCGSFEFRPSSSNSSLQTHINSTNSSPEIHDNDMETSSSASASSRSEVEPEKDSAYGSCDSDDAEQMQNYLREYQRRRSSGDHGRFKRILTVLSEETDPSGQLSSLTELCEVLSFCTENSLSIMMSESLSLLLVKFVKQDGNPDIMLLALRAMTYLCDACPRSSSLLVRNEAIPALCQKLMAIEYLDVAEQCLQALEKISREQPLACLQGGATMAVLNYIEFFSTSLQRVAISTVVNICKKLPSEFPSPLMEAVPILCNLLQYEDRQLVENVVICIMKIAERVSKSSEMLDELCKHGLIHQVTRLIGLNSRSTSSKPVYTGSIGLLVKLASTSTLAFTSLHELNISNILKDLLCAFDLSHGMYSAADGQCNQAIEVLKLLDVLLPTKSGDEGDQEMLEKETFLVTHPDLLQKFGMNILPLLIQVVNSGASLYVCYGCLSVMHKILCLSKAEMLVELLQNSKIASFLAGVFTRKDHHVLILALKIAEMTLQKLSHSVLNAFIKEGVFFAIDALLSSEKCPRMNSAVFKDVQPAYDSSQKYCRDILRCLCYYSFSTGTGQSFSSSEALSCKLEKDSVQNLAKQIRTKYFAPDLCQLGGGVTDILQLLQSSSAALDELLNAFLTDDSIQNEEKCYAILLEIIEKLKGNEPISTFEFIESGIVKALMNYLSNCQYLKEKQLLNGVYGQISVLEKRFEVFARLFLSYSDPLSGESLLSKLIRKLLSALSSLENFPVVLSHESRQRHGFAAVPNGRRTTYPCLRVRFLRGDGEIWLCDYSEDVLTVDPLSSLDAIIGFLWPKVSIKRAKHIRSASEAGGQTECLPLKLPSVESPVPRGSSDVLEPESMSADLSEMQKDEANPSQPAPDGALSLGPANSCERTSVDETHVGFTEADNVLKAQHSSPKLSLYLDGRKLDNRLSLYQAILQLQIKEGEITSSTNLLGQVYTLTYKLDTWSKESSSQDCFCESDKAVQCTSVFSDILAWDLTSDLQKPSPTYDVLSLLKCLEGMNSLLFNLLSRERTCAFAEGRSNDLDDLKFLVPSVRQTEFLSSKLTEKLEQQMRDCMAVSIGGMPSWCNELMTSCPFLFSFEARCKYFQLAAFGPLQQPHLRPHSNSGITGDRRTSSGSFPRKKFLVSREQVLGSAAEMMDHHAHQKVLLEVEFNDEVGTGLGPTLEFYTLVSHELQKSGLGMWRENHDPFISGRSLQAEDGRTLMSPFGIFPRPWSSDLDATDGGQFSEVIKKFVLLGQVVARAIQDGRVLDICFSKAFYKLMLGKEINMYDIQTFAPELGRTLLEFWALVERRNFLNSVGGERLLSNMDLCFHGTKIEDLCLDFTLPGYSDYVLTSEPDHATVNMSTLEDYIVLVVDATVNAGISRQIEAFKSGFNQVFPIEHLQTFTAEELECLLCGEHDSWALRDQLDYIKFDHGYTASSSPIINLLEIIQEFDNEQRRAFLQFVTGTPRLPPGGLASLNPRLTIVRKHCSNQPDMDLPSVMTCANYLKLPAYSSKDIMKEKLLYAITEGQGSFHLS